jgi:hypothetical protein
MKKVLGIIIISTTLLFAKANYQDVVYLKNGSIIRGTIVEQIPEKTIKIRTGDNNVFVYSISEVEKKTKEPVKILESNESERKSIINDGNGLKAGIKGIIEAGQGIGVGKNKANRFVTNIILAYQFNPFISFGLGSGIRYYEDMNIPFFGDFRAYLFNNSFSPYISLNTGWLVSGSNYAGVGTFFAPAIGGSFKFSPDSPEFNISIGYELQSMEVYFEHSYGWGDTYRVKQDINFSAINLIMGVSF